MTTNANVKDQHLEIRVSDRHERLRLGSRLRTSLGTAYVRPTAGGYRVPRELISQLLDVIPLEDVLWSGEARELADDANRRRGLQLAARLEVAGALAEPGRTIDGLHLPVELDGHQREAAAAIAAPSLRGLALFDEQGTGKTISVLVAYLALRERGQVKRLLVVCPKTVLGQWKADAARVLVDTYSVAVAIGSSRARKASILSEHDILVASYEAVVADQQLLLTILRAEPGRYMLAVDESYYAKNRSARRSAALADLRPWCERAVVLCGTPAPNAPWDLIHQLELADGGLAVNRPTRPADKDAEHAVVERALANSIYLRRMKADVLPDLPGQQFVELSVDLSQEQRTIYERALTDLVLRVRGVTEPAFQRDLQSFLARRTALLQICSHPGGLDPLYLEIPGKLAALDRLLDELIIQREEKVVIWSWFRFSLEAIAQRYASYGIARVDGSVTSATERMRAIDSFQGDSEVRLFVGNAAAAGAGITLTAAHSAIYESLSNQAAHYMQSVDRIHRRGLEHDVTHRILVTRGTVEEIEFERLRSKQRQSRELLNDPPVVPVTRETFLSGLGMPPRGSP